MVSYGSSFLLLPQLLFNRMRSTLTVPRTSLVAPRVVGRYSQNREGNLVLVFGGIHGNEVSGVLALRSIFRHLEATKPSFRGKVVGISGNLAALAAGKRYIDTDLNRHWSEDGVRRLRGENTNMDPAPASAAKGTSNGTGHSRDRTGLGTTDSSEDREAVQLLKAIDEELAEGGPWTDRIFVDLHATSAGGGGFSIIQDAEANREIAARMHLPLIFGIEKKLQSTLMSHLYARGMNGVVFEGGRIGSQEAIDVHTAGLWTLLTSLGCLHPKDVPDYRYQINRMIDAAEGLPKAVRTIYRHRIDSEDAFRMLPGYRNFQPVLKDQHLGDDAYGPVLAPLDALLLMPLYQEQGSDGFFLVEAVDY